MLTNALPKAYRGLFWMSENETVSISNNAFQYHPGIDPPVKLFRLAAINQALACDRPRHRHGACMAMCSCDVSQHRERLGVVLAVGKNEVQKDPTKVHRSGSVRHAEISCLLQVVQLSYRMLVAQRLAFAQVLQQNKTFSFRDANHLLSPQKRPRLRDPPCMYIVELDDYDVGYWEAQACPLCTPALAKAGVRMQHFTTPNGFASQQIRFRPTIEYDVLKLLRKSKVVYAKFSCLVSSIGHQL